jgi:hypothetical protein
MSPEHSNTACDDCLRRTALIVAVAGRLDVEWRRRSAPAGVLSLADDALAALDPSGAAARHYAGFSAAAARDAIRAAGLSAVCAAARRRTPPACASWPTRPPCSTSPAGPRR